MFMSCENNAEDNYSVKRAIEFFEKCEVQIFGNDTNKSKFHVQEIEQIKFS
jgi:hypothetical protein